MKIALIQSKVLGSTFENIAAAKVKVAEAKRSGAKLAVLPEMFSCPYQTDLFRPNAFREGSDKYKAIQDIAVENSIYLVAGTVPEISKDSKVYNTSYAFSPDGSLIAKHRKAHLFDIDVEGGISFKESETLSPGTNITVFETEYAKIGLCICYDIRFPELSKLMVDKGAEIIIVPAAFNMTTGPAHWELTFRARALDNQVYTIGCAPARDLSASYHSYGNSIVCSPWGEVVARLDEKEGILYADIDLDYIKKVRSELPLLKHRRDDLYALIEK